MDRYLSIFLKLMMLRTAEDFFVSHVSGKKYQALPVTTPAADCLRQLFPSGAERFSQMGDAAHFDILTLYRKQVPGFAGEFTKNHITGLTITSPAGTDAKEVDKKSGSIII